MVVEVAQQKDAPIRILLVDDHVILRQGMCLMLNEEEDFEVVGEAENEKVALSLALESKPDIILVDLSLETSNGLDTAKQLLRCAPDTHIVLFAGSNNEKLLFDAIRIGVHGYLQKTLSIDDLLRALRAIQCRERVLGESQAVTQVVIEFHAIDSESATTRTQAGCPCINQHKQFGRGESRKKQLFPMISVVPHSVYSVGRSGRFTHPSDHPLVSMCPFGNHIP